jgi:hypothetical protein
MENFDAAGVFKNKFYPIVAHAQAKFFQFSVSAMDSGEESSIKSIKSSRSFFEMSLGEPRTPRKFLSLIIVRVEVCLAI